MRERKLKPRHQNFAELIVQGKTATAAYAACFPRCTASSAESEGSRLQHKPAVAAFIAKIRAESAEKFKADTVVTLRETLEYLTEVIRTPAGQVNEGHRLYQGGRPTPGIREVKIPCKLRAVELAMKLQGLFTGKVQHDVGDTLVDFLRGVRAGGVNTFPPRLEELKPRHQKFAELVVQGYGPQAAYLACFPRCAKPTARIQGSRLHRKPEVAAVIAGLRAELAERVKSEIVVTLQEALEFLTEIIRTPAGMVSEGHQLCQSVKNTPRTREVKLPCKIRALELAMKLQGLLSVPQSREQHEAGDTLTDFLVNLRAGDG